ncbi:MAG: carboxymuconolactone decarboxylase family protein [Candidatus Hodarchaeales archaeon]|jgi:AhpD family alkylhydroperoxidase
MNRREKEIAAIAASVALGCVRCLEYHKMEGISEDIIDEDLLEIGQIAFKVRKNAHRFSRAEMDRILSLDGSEKDPVDNEPGEEKHLCAN